MKKEVEIKTKEKAKRWFLENKGSIWCDLGQGTMVKAYYYAQAKWIFDNN